MHQRNSESNRTSILPQAPTVQKIGLHKHEIVVLRLFEPLSPLSQLMKRSVMEQCTSKRTHHAKLMLMIFQRSFLFVPFGIKGQGIPSFSESIFRYMSNQ